VAIYAHTHRITKYQICIQLIKITWQQHFPLLRHLHPFSHRATNLNLFLSTLLCHLLYLPHIWTYTVYFVQLFPHSSHTPHPTDFLSSFIVWKIGLDKRGGARDYMCVCDVCMCVYVRERERESHRIKSILPRDIGGS